MVGLSNLASALQEVLEIAKVERMVEISLPRLLLQLLEGGDITEFFHSGGLAALCCCRHKLLQD